MCGIAGIQIKPHAKGTIPVGNLLDWLLVGIEPRGKEATGFLSVGFDRQIQMDKAPITASDFIKNRKTIRSLPQTVLAHTRLATQGDPKFNENNHPVQYGTVFVTHNGWIVNDTDLFKEFDLEVTAEVDSLAIPAMLWTQNEGSWSDVGIKVALEKLQGAMAIAAVDVTRPGQLLLARGNSSPLVVLETNDLIMWASTEEAIKLAWGKVFGTPPGKKRYRHLDEGEWELWEDGVVSLKGTFEPSYTVRYNWGYSAWDDEDWDNWYEQKYQGTTIGSNKGYWITLPNGERTWASHEDDDTLAGVADGPPMVEGGVGMTLRPSAESISVIRNMTVWAELDSQTHEDTLYTLASDLQIPMIMAAWIMLYATNDVIEANPHLKQAKDWMMQRYNDIYDEALNENLAASNATITKVEDKDDTPPAPELVHASDRVKLLCPECQETYTGGRVCTMCIETLAGIEAASDVTVITAQDIKQIPAHTGFPPTCQRCYQRPVVYEDQNVCDECIMDIEYQARMTAADIEYATRTTLGDRIKTRAQQALEVLR